MYSVLYRGCADQARARRSVDEYRHLRRVRVASYSCTHLLKAGFSTFCRREAEKHTAMFFCTVQGPVGCRIATSTYNGLLVLITGSPKFSSNILLSDYEIDMAHALLCIHRGQSLTKAYSCRFPKEIGEKIFKNL